MLGKSRALKLIFRLFMNSGFIKAGLRDSFRGSYYEIRVKSSGITAGERQCLVPLEILNSTSQH